MSATQTQSAELLREDHAGIVRLTMNRPHKRNALSRTLLAAIDHALDCVAADPDARVVVLGGTGPVFCSGHDLGEMIDQEEIFYRDLFSLCSMVMQKLRRIPQPVIARVHGPASAAGCQLVAACDLAVAVESATFATPGVKIGLFCTTPMVPIVRAVGAKPALEMLFTGQPISAQQALAWGLINRVVPTEKLDEMIGEFTAAIVAVSPLTVRLGKEAFYHQLHLDENAAYDLATEVMTANALKHDAQEGMTAFLQKRSPQWRGK